MPETGTAAPPPDLNGSVERVVLIGFMGAGKSTVGRLLARTLGWDFVDLDRVVEETAGSTIAEVIGEQGLERFRELEAEAGRGVLRRRRVVVAVGGGWAAEPGHMDMLDGRSLAVWLKVSPEAAVARLRTTLHSRPLLDVAEPIEAARGLLRARVAHYGRCGITIDTEHRSPGQVVREILRQPILWGEDKEESE